LRHKRQFKRGGLIAGFNILKVVTTSVFEFLSNYTNKIVLMKNKDNKGHKGVI